MRARAVAKYIGVSPSKVRLVVDTIRGKKVDEALSLLRFSPKVAARAVAKVVKSAAANAENNYQMTPSEMRIVGVFADEGRRLKRFRPRSRGRASPILKRSCHITVVVEEKET